MTSISQLFDFGGQPIRVAGTPEHPLFRVADLCAALEIVNVGDAVSRLPDDDLERISSTDVGKNTAKRGCPPPKPAVYVTEPGMYKLIMGARKLAAQSFQRWVTAEVLPTIRRTGAYDIVAESERKRVVERFFLGLPESQTPMFSELIDALRPLTVKSPGTPPWARLVASWIYSWTFRELKPELRARNPKQVEGTLRWRDYETLTTEGREMVARTIAKCAFAAEEAVSWEDWRSRMEAHYSRRPRQLWMRLAPQLSTRKCRGERKS